MAVSKTVLGLLPAEAVFRRGKETYPLSMKKADVNISSLNIFYALKFHRPALVVDHWSLGYVRALYRAGSDIPNVID